MNLDAYIREGTHPKWGRGFRLTKLGLKLLSEEAARRYGGSPLAWKALVLQESGGWFNAVNPSSYATGLIQFMPRTTAWLIGRKLSSPVTEAEKREMSSYVLRMSPYDQTTFMSMYIEKTLKGRRVSTDADVAMIVFYPAYIGKPDEQFPENVTAANNGLLRPRDYVASMMAKVASREASLA